MYATRFGSRIRPARGAVKLLPEDRAQQGIARPEAVEAAAEEAGAAEHAGDDSPPAATPRAETR